MIAPFMLTFQTALLQIFPKSAIRQSFLVPLFISLFFISTYLFKLNIDFENALALMMLASLHRGKDTKTDRLLYMLPFAIFIESTLIQLSVLLLYFSYTKKNLIQALILLTLLSYIVFNLDLILFIQVLIAYIIYNLKNNNENQKDMMINSSLFFLLYKLAPAYYLFCLLLPFLSIKNISKFISLVCISSIFVIPFNYLPIIGVIFIANLLLNSKELNYLSEIKTKYDVGLLISSLIIINGILVFNLSVDNNIFKLLSIPIFMYTGSQLVSKIKIKASYESASILAILVVYALILVQ